jgi:N-acetylglucosamine repressor
MDSPSEEKRNILRGKNVFDVLTILQQKSSLSRAELARITQLTPATISNVVAELHKLGIVREHGHGVSQGGRRPIMIELNPESFYLSGIDLGITKIIAVITDLHGNIIARKKRSVDVYSGGNRIIQSMLEAADDCFHEAGSMICRKIVGIGLSVSGLVNMEKGISIYAPNLPMWKNVPLVKTIEDKFHLPAFIENDARCMALGEARYGSGRSYKNLLCINVGHGIGSGIIINGDLYRGEAYAAGEIGHLTIIPSGPLCQCGNRGCLEVIAGGHAIAAAAIRVLNSGGQTLIREIVKGKINRVTAEIVAKAAAQGDPIARDLIIEAAHYIGIGLANALNLLSPEIIIIGGGVALSGDIFFHEIRRTIRKRAFTTMINEPELLLSSLGENASSIGAAALVFEKILEQKQLLLTESPLYMKN